MRFRLPEFLDSRHMNDKVVSPTYWLPLPPREIPMTSIGNQTRDLPAYSAVPQPNGPPRTPKIKGTYITPTVISTSSEVECHKENNVFQLSLLMKKTTTWAVPRLRTQLKYKLPYKSDAKPAKFRLF